MMLLWQPALLRGHESHQHPAVRVLMFDFSTRAVATRIILVRSSTAESRHLVRGGAQAKTIGSSDRTNRLCQAIISYPDNSPASVAGSFVARSFPKLKIEWRKFRCLHRFVLQTLPSRSANQRL